MTCKFIGRPSGQAPENKSQYGITFYDDCFTCSSGRRSTPICSSSQPTAQAPRCAIFSNVLYGRTEHVGKGGGGNAVMEMGLEKADAHSASSLAASPGIVAGGPCANASGPVRRRPRSPRCYTPVPRRAGLAGDCACAGGTHSWRRSLGATSVWRRARLAAPRQHLQSMVAVMYGWPRP